MLFDLGLRRNVAYSVIRSNFREKKLAKNISPPYVMKKQYAEFHVSKFQKWRKLYMRSLLVPKWITLTFV